MVVSILGISAFYHDSAACLVVDGEIVAAAQEERFTRIKHDHNFPLHAARYCLSKANLSAGELSYVGFYDKPLLKFDRLLETYLDYAPSGFSSFLKALPLWMKEKLWMPDLIRTELAKAGGEQDERVAKKLGKLFAWKLLFGDHHESHAASAFYPSPFEEAAILTIDGVGEWATSSIGIGKGNEITLLKELRFPDSLGLLYSAFTYYTGFRVNSGEYKVMGLAPYGEPKYVPLIKDKLLEVRIQVITEEVMLKMTKYAYKETGMKKLCMAGGVSLNCVANGRVLREVPFEDIWIQPAAGDAGGALGIALAIWHRYLGNARMSPQKQGTWQSARAPESNSGKNTGNVSGSEVRNKSRKNGLAAYADGMKGSFLGPRHSEDEIEEFLQVRQLPYEKYSRKELPGAVADLLAAGKIIGLHQGRMEFGPRALGGRSIIGDPRSPEMQSLMNLKIKYRESFRPFAPSVLREQVSEWFELDTDSPYMLLVANVGKPRRREVTAAEEGRWGIDKLNVKRSEIPAVTHVDYSARIQTVRRETNPRYWEIIEAFRQKTGCPVVVNTSFNVRGEPIVCTPEDSYRCFMRTEMDYLVLETCMLDKQEQPVLAETEDWKTRFKLD